MNGLVLYMYVCSTQFIQVPLKTWMHNDTVGEGALLARKQDAGLLYLVQYFPED